MASFRRFPDLPKELRDIIWDYATQRKLAGVQIFDLRTPEPKNDGGTPNIMTLGARRSRQQLAAPLPSKYFPTLYGSTSTLNVSRYMADIGLWTACKESREVMEKTTQRTKRILERQAKKKHRYFCYVEHVPAILPCSTSQRCLAQPHTDIFLLQPSKIKDIDWSRAARDMRKQFDPRSFRFRINIGIEWNVQWGIKDEDEDFNLLCQAFENISAQGKFIEVSWQYESLERWRHIKPPERKCIYTGEDESSLSLVRDLENIADEEHGRWLSYGPYEEDDAEPFGWEPKLLGWDYL
ncbi:hypothetical protein FACUT_11661 [Fusarium acutatum]|uniref:2EXR domain-containing protein n=1 Tax=Fusarium acutatum TaxID=78861 RepID=A0A8H4NAF2_9HYPO|nr:hypothetical protein FACUT_11661 [Fusarium acutatum]